MNLSKELENLIDKHPKDADIRTLIVESWKLAFTAGKIAGLERALALVPQPHLVDEGDGEYTARRYEGENTANAQTRFALQAEIAKHRSE